MFADDTSLFLSHPNYHVLHNLFNSELKLISEWFYANKMTINLTKTNYMIFSNLFVPDSLSVRMCNTDIKCVTSVKFLGITIDHKFT